MELIAKQKRHWQEFSSVTDVLDFITLDKFIQKDSPTYSGANPGTYGHKDFLETVRMMNEGWPDGRDRIEEFVVDIEKRVMGYLPVVEVAYDVEGQWFDEGRYLSGEPEVFGYFRETDEYQERKGGRIIHMVLNIDITWKPFERGAAGVAIIDALERMGHRVVADAIANSRGQGGKLLETRIRVKNSNEPVQLDKLAFVFAHKNVFDHVLCAAWERLPLPIRQIYGFDYSYGAIANVPAEDRGDIYIPRTAGWHGNTNQDIADWVLGVLKQNGIQIQENIQ